MKIVAISVVRNEADILESFVRYHLQLAGHLLLVDHCSEDGSRWLLEQLKNEGLPLTVQHDDSAVNSQNVRMTMLMRKAFAEYGADWVLPLDGDEFLVAEGDLKEILANVPGGMFPLVPWRTYVPSGNEAGFDVLSAITDARAEETPLYCKIAVPRTCDWQRVIMQIGSHGVEITDGKPAYHPCPQLRLAHFPVRSERQLRAKILHGYASHLLRKDIRPGEMFHWKQLVNRCMLPEPIGADELRRIAMHYPDPADGTDRALVSRPVVPQKTFMLRYTPQLAQCQLAS
jgi:Glycosyl transferase family 2